MHIYRTRSEFAAAGNTYCTLAGPAKYSAHKHYRRAHFTHELLGYSRFQTFVRIVLPQVIKRILPSVTNEVVTLVKDTSMAFTVSYQEMFTIGKQIANSQTSFVPFIVAGLFYYVFNLVVDFVMGRAEKRLSYYK